MNRPMTFFFAAAVTCAHLAMPGLIQSADSDPCGGHFPLLRANVAAKASGQPGQQTDIETLLREVKIEKALWLDEVQHQRVILAAGGAGSTRLDDVDALMRGRFEEIEAFVRGDASLSEQTRGILESCSAERSTFPSGPLSAASVLPVLGHRLPSLPTPAFPEGYGDPPSEGLRDLVLVAEKRAKAGFEPTRPDVIHEKVIELSRDPMALYAFVLHQIRPALSGGSMRGPVSVLQSGEGNDTEQSALLAALFREAGYPARIAWGVQETDLASLLDHYGADDYQSLESTLTAAGVAWEPVLSGGVPASYRLERVWCEVWLPFGNFRGVVLDASASRWLALDPYLKNFVRSEDLPVLDRMDFDHGPWLNSYLAGDFCTAPLDEVGACPAPRDVLLGQVELFLDGTGSTVEEETSPPELSFQDEPILPTAMVGRIVAVSGVGIDAPLSLQHRIRIVAKDGPRVLFDEELAATDLVGRESVIWFVPASDEDEAIVAAYGGELWRTPPYLIDVSLELLIDGQSVRRGTEALGVGRSFELEFILTAPGENSLSYTNLALAGVPVGVGMAPGRQSWEPLFGEPSNTPELMAHLAGSWLDGVAGFEEEMAALGGGSVLHPFPNMVSVGSVVRTAGTLGLIEEMQWLGASVDADVLGSRLSAEDVVRRRWMQLVQLDASVRERLLFEDYGTPSVSADKALMLAQRDGVVIHHIDAANLGATLPTLPFETSVVDEIQGWVLAGGEAWVPAVELRTLEWTGVGYLLLDPESGESRYQLAGRLSGGMTAAPPFEVVEGLRDPLQYPSADFVNSDPTAAVVITLFDGNLQIGTAGETLSEDNDGIPLKVRVFDLQGRPVKGATVTFEVLGGGGGFGGPGIATITAVSNPVGIATTVLTLGSETSDNPYYLLFPDDEHATRCGLTVVTASVNGHGMPDVFWEIAQPGDLDQLLTPRGDSVQALPHLSAGSLVAVPADQYDNPISNVEVSYVLQGSSGGAGEGPELLGRDEKEQCRPGVVVAGECPGGGTSKTETGGVSGTWVYLIVGDEDTTVTATATSDTGTASTTFFGHSRTERVPGGPFVGWPVLLVSRRGQPVNHTGEILEAYAPGAPSLPLQVALFIVREDYGIYECDSDVWCTSPRGTYQTTRLSHGPVEDCSPDGCSAGSLEERGQVAFSGAGSSATIGVQDANGNYTHQLTMPTAPGRYPVTASPTIWVAAPRIPNDPDYINEIVPCPGTDDACGARLDIYEVSDPGWQTEFVLWSVLAEVTSPPPVVKLGHRNLHEEAQNFPYTIEPSNYPAIETTVYFLEDGLIRMRALAQGAGTEPAQLPPGAIFAHPEGHHQVGIALNAGWVWQPYPGEAVSMMIEGEHLDFSIVMGELDVDSNNDNAADPPDRDDLEDAIEGGESPPESLDLPNGKYIFVNHNNDNLNETPDYAELQVDEEGNMVPLVVEVRPEDGDWQGTKVTFTYDGPMPDQDPPQIPIPNQTWDPIGAKSVYDYEVRQDYEYRDYSSVKIGAIRIWNVEDQDDARTPEMFMVPGQDYFAAELGFSAATPSKQFWIEAINGAGAGEALAPVEITLKVTLETDFVEDTVTVYPVEGNLGVNNSNVAIRAADNSYQHLRHGVPDAGFTIDEHDEMVEDQGDGFRLWRSEDMWADMARIEDLAPLVVEVPQELVDAGYEFWLKLDSPEEEKLRVAKVPDGSTRLNHLRLKDPAEAQVHLVNSFGHTVLDGSRSHIENLGSSRNELVFLAGPRYSGQETQINKATLHLLAKPPGAAWLPWVPVDSLRLTLAPIESFFAAYSARGNDGTNAADQLFDYPIEVIDGQGKIVKGEHFPAADHVDAPIGNVPKTGSKNPDIKPYLVWLHGYNVSFEKAIDWGRSAAKRLFWVGYRGNLILWTWKGDPPGALGWSEFGLANQWGLQTSETLRIFLRDEMQGSWGVPADKITVLGHSLGNLVVYDAMRLDRARAHLGMGPAPSTKLFSRFISTEAAIWGETLWPQAPVEYCSSTFDIPPFCWSTTYSIRELQCSSWTFWFNQQDQEAWKAVDTIFHSYSPGDNVLTFVMRVSDWLLRQDYPFYNHFDRPDCDEPHHFRVPWWVTPVQGEPDYSDNPTLSHGEWLPGLEQRGCPVMLDVHSRPLFPTHGDFVMPAGAAPHPMGSSAHPGLTLGGVDALSLDWDDGGLNPIGGHSNCKDESFPDIFSWWHTLVNGGGLPRGTEF